MCQHFTVKDAPLAQLGLYLCKLGPKWEYPNPFIERDCDKFAQVPPDQAQARIDWERGLAK